MPDVSITQVGGPSVEILYTNWRGETAWRRVIPLRVVFKATDWHPEPQWILEALDADKEAERSFALKDVKQWGRS